ncbi:WAS/WASL-interacting protein family member 3-like [Macrobrachium rosenbergii]|uniref:WAS/WASL-interacting protein family member 3-like n=1 Tax=Macrobrachium rosenbergii TaxID=79674 RepID=UPI0034D41CDA
MRYDLQEQGPFLRRKAVSLSSAEGYEIPLPSHKIDIHSRRKTDDTSHSVRIISIIRHHWTKRNIATHPLRTKLRFARRHLNLSLPPPPPPPPPPPFTASYLTAITSHRPSPRPSVSISMSTSSLPFPPQALPPLPPTIYSSFSSLPSILNLLYLPKGSSSVSAPRVMHSQPTFHHLHFTTIPTTSISQHSAPPPPRSLGFSLEAFLAETTWVSS